MNDLRPNDRPEITDSQVEKFEALVARLYQCCSERMQYQSEKFGLPDAQLRCLLLFGEERYLTPKGISQKLNVVKSRVTPIVGALIKKRLIQRIKDPEDSRIRLLSLTPDGLKKLREIKQFMGYVHREVLANMGPEQRKIMMTNLDLLKASMESVKELMV
jgi:DNA-binding MarR family transcriptional regulator